MNKLYPLKFNPIVKDKIWGGRRLKSMLNKTAVSGKAGESWEISGVRDNISVVSEGFLEGNNLQELIEIYLGDLVGDHVYEKYGKEFPLLIKFIDATDKLSIQVHPGDELAMKRHGSHGKTEMWYVIQSDKNAEITVGFNREITPDEYLKHLQSKTVEQILNIEKAMPGDVFFLPAGRVHAIGAGILLAEIQQTSDVTYRIYDYDRKDEMGNLRELHTGLALDAIDFTHSAHYKTSYASEKNQPSNLIACNYFITNLIGFDRSIERDYIMNDSCVIYICIEGKISIRYRSGENITADKGESVLIPAIIKNLELVPSGFSRILEVTIP